MGEMLAQKPSAQWTDTVSLHELGVTAMSQAARSMRDAFGMNKRNMFGVQRFRKAWRPEGEVVSLIET